MNIQGKVASALLATLLLAACGGGLNGTYTGPMGATSFTFKSGNTVDVSVMGATTEMHYKVDGRKVKVGMKGGPMQVWTLQKDGSISGPGGVTLTKKK